MADKPPGKVGKKRDPRIEGKPADQGLNGQVPEGEHPMGTPTSDRAETETAGKKDKAKP